MNPELPVLLPSEFRSLRSLRRHPRPIPEEDYLVLNRLGLAARDYDPSRLNRYVTELAARFHRFYTVCRIKGAEEDVQAARLLLADCVRRVIALSLGIIGVHAPEKM